MDFLKKGSEMLKKSQGSSSSGQEQQQQQQQTGGQQKDYGDKALEFIEKKTGHQMGAGTNEKITDGLRGLYEKNTGKKVDPKWSN
ncbi:uncharacterized protein L3040_003584 [Drepanopeziza brunnea f. sp. 'multigermtubi']|uniref:Uncharacterized protein n=1 Tax=Marssonina brunnea f. sp. multigermtubi (strain MB_m1) TaxID=1072389 RepID=K1WED7_MARBU|nr:uncharacterized protein MBM_05806 [Drepanopeziza brunnea f. sp. 'multigermtubi' MB_m1]EKD15795.1 hypothetical protein MBM_05806 [Drepanopeziza brunnea f. sp. 'multigermtubi' MB_m1]KAJ5046339.1 hypothetical protein L3040_003584 [Drepanopeziza brunnea f. sp. 'multigermtubi']